MPSPFPGMDPFLEDPGGWLDVHNSLIAYLRDDLNSSLSGRYVARVTERVVVEHSFGEERSIVPDVVVAVRGRTPRQMPVTAQVTPLWVKAAAVEVPEWSLEIRDRRGKRLVTAVEILSPSNKSPHGDGREQYLQKQREILASRVNLVEIDLLRAGGWTLAAPRASGGTPVEFDYAVSVSRAADRSGFEFYPIRLDQRLPPIAIPLEVRDADAVADLQSLLDRCYDRGRYGDEIDYARAPVPPLSTRQSAWARRLIRRARRK